MYFWLRRLHIIKWQHFPRLIYCDALQSRLWFSQWSCMDVIVGRWRKQSAKELMLLNCGIEEDSWESLGLQGDPTTPSWRRSVLGVHWKDSCWSWNSNTLATSCKELTRDAGRDWGQEEKGTTEDEMAGWHHRLDGHGFGWNPGVCDGQGGLACCGSWGCKESDTSEWLNWTELNCYQFQWHFFMGIK